MMTNRTRDHLLALVMLGLVSLVTSSALAADDEAVAAIAEGLAELYDRMNDRADADGVLGMIGALGADQMMAIQLWHVRHATFRNEDSGQSRNITGLDVEISAATAPSLFGGSFGIDAAAGLNFPGAGYPGLLHLRLGPHASLNVPGPIDLRVGVGFAVTGRDVHGYLYPRVALRLASQFDVEAGFYYVHPRASHIPDGGNRLEDAGIGFQRLRLSAFVHFKDPRYEDDLTPAVQVFVDRWTFSGQDEILRERQLRRGDFLGGGLGVAF